MLIPFRDNIRSERTPIATYTIIAVCVVAFGLQVVSRDHLERWMFVPADLLSLGAWHDRGILVVFGSLLTSMFLHGGVMHIGSNMLFMWVFGDNVESRVGTIRFVGFYLLCGLVAALVHALYTFIKFMMFGAVVDGRSEAEIATIGASGAVAGVLGAYVRLFPRATVRSLALLFIIFTVIELPALIFIGIWFLLQLFSGYSALFSAWGGGVAVWAHIGGFLVGYILVGRLAKRRRPSSDPRVLRFDVE